MEQGKRKEECLREKGKGKRCCAMGSESLIINHLL